MISKGFKRLLLEHLTECDKALQRRDAKITTVAPHGGPSHLGPVSR
jgi:hypothetical protein